MAKKGEVKNFVEEMGSNRDGKGSLKRDVSFNNVYESLDENPDGYLNSEINTSKPVNSSNPQTLWMEEMVKVAHIYYNTSSKAVKKTAEEFFNKLDSDKDGKVGLQEFLGFMTEEGHSNMSSKSFFQTLGKDKSVTLEFMEVMALYYIIKSGRPFCGGCDNFIPGMYFTCSNCFDNSHKSFSVCSTCFNDKKFKHDSNHKFLDNFALLEAKRKDALLATQCNQYQSFSSRTIAELPTSATASTSNAVKP